jgi:hypothetical protein
MCNIRRYIREKWVRTREAQIEYMITLFAMRSTLNHNKISLEVKTRPPYDHSINWPVHDPPFRPSSLEHQKVSIDMAQDLVAVRNLVSKVNALGGMFLLVQFMHRFAFILIFFRQYLHFTVCLMIGSSATSSAMLAIAYKAKPTPRKLMILLRKLLTSCQSLLHPHHS